MKKILYIFLPFLFLVPSFAFAANTHHYTCSDFSTDAHSACVGDVFSFTSGGWGHLFYNAGTSYDMTAGTWYISFDVVGTLTPSDPNNFYIVPNVGGDPTNAYAFTSSQTATAISVGALGGLYIGNFSSDASISNLCVTDTAGDCEAPPPPPPPPAGDFGGLIATAASGFATSTGFSIGAITTYTGDTLIKVFIGSGLGVLLGLRWWIIACLVIAVIIAFSRRAYQFFRH